MEQSDAQVFGFVDHFAVHFHDAVGDADDQTAHDHAFEVDVVTDHLVRRQHHAGELHFADAERAALAEAAQPAEEKPDHLPHRIETEATRHHRVALEMAFEKPKVGAHVHLGHDLTLVVAAAAFGNAGDSVEHQHGGRGQARVSGAEQLAFGAGQEACHVEIRSANGSWLVHFV